jgi:exoribonuclease-2
VKLVGTDSVHGFIDFEYTPGVEPAKDERRDRKRAAAVALRDRIGDSFRAIVTGTSPRATWIKTVPEGIEGRLVRGRKGLKPSSELGVVLLTADPVRGFIDFAREDTVLPAAN